MACPAWWRCRSSAATTSPRSTSAARACSPTPPSAACSMLQDGLPINRADGSYIVGLIDARQADLIEVFRGYTANRLGAQTLGGAINFISPTGTSAPGVEIGTEAGSFGHLLTTARAGARQGDRRHLRAGQLQPARRLPRLERVRAHRRLGQCRRQDQRQRLDPHLLRLHRPRLRGARSLVAPALRGRSAAGGARPHRQRQFRPQRGPRPAAARHRAGPRRLAHHRHRRRQHPRCRPRLQLDRRFLPLPDRHRLSRHHRRRHHGVAALRLPARQGRRPAAVRGHRAVCRRLLRARLFHQQSGRQGRRSSPRTTSTPTPCRSAPASTSRLRRAHLVAGGGLRHAGRDSPTPTARRSGRGWPIRPPAAGSADTRHQHQLLARL